MKILNYGSLNIDYTYSVDHFVRGGETMSSEEMHVFSGGKGLNPVSYTHLDVYKRQPLKSSSITVTALKSR